MSEQYELTDLVRGVIRCGVWNFKDSYPTDHEKLIKLIDTVQANTVREQVAKVLRLQSKQTPDDVREALKHLMAEYGAEVMAKVELGNTELLAELCEQATEELLDKHIQPLIEAAIREHKNALEFARGAIEDAIYSEDGLDGGAGQIVINMITEVLDDKDEYESTFKDGE